MPDKRDIHKAKSHRNSRNKSSQQKAARRTEAPSTNTAMMTEQQSAPTKKNKDRR